MEISVWMSGSGQGSGWWQPVPLTTNQHNSIRWNQAVSDNQSPGPESRNRRPGPPSGGQSAVEPPGPIPNPEVKRCSADGIGTTGPVRVGRRQVFARHPQQCGCRALFLPGCRGRIRRATGWKGGLLLRSRLCEVTEQLNLVFRRDFAEPVTGTQA